MIERAPDGRIIIRFPPMPEPEPDPVFSCVMCSVTVQQWKFPADPDICSSCFRTFKRARVRRDFHEKTYHADGALDVARDIIATIEHETKHGPRF